MKLPRIRCAYFAVGSALAMLCSPLPAATEWYVATNGDGSAGTNWPTAFSNVQSALDAAAPGDTLYLAGHTFWVTNQIDWSKSDLVLLGGYAATNADELPGPFDAEQWRTTIMRLSGTTRIIYLHNLTNAVLRRTTIQGGYVDQNYGWGAGLYLYRAQGVELTDCRVLTNRSYQGGATVEGAAGLYAWSSSGVLSNCLVQANAGSGQYNSGGRGAGVNLASTGTWTIVDSIIAGNTMSPGSSGRGGGIYVDGVVCEIRNCVVAANHAYAGAGIYVNAGTCTVGNATIVNNDWSGVYRGAGSLAVNNSILWGNGDDVGGAVGLYYCSVEDGDTNGVNGCISEPPLFERGLYLATNSLCVDAGSDTAANLGLAGRTTRADGVVDGNAADLGYHFAGGIDWSVAEIFVATNGSDSNPGTNATAPLATISAALQKAGPGSHIHLEAGTYSTNSGDVFPLVLDKWGLMLLGTNRDQTVLLAPGVNSVDRRVIEVDNALGDGRLEGLTVSGGRTENIFGAGLGVFRSMLEVVDCDVRGNRGRYNVYNGTSSGGGLYSFYSTLVLSNSVVRGNESYQNQDNSSCAGGGLYVRGGACEIVGSVIRDNIAYNYSGSGSSYGANLYFYDGRHRIFNSLVSGGVGRYNLAAGGIYATAAGQMTLSVENTDILGNLSQGVNRGGGTVTVSNSIVWANGDDIAGTVGLYYSAIEDGDNAGTNGCIASNPLFERGLYLRNGSDCIDGGGALASAVGLAGLTTQTDGAPDVDLVDMGFHQTNGLAGVADLYVAPGGSDGNGGTGWGDAVRSVTRALALAQDGTHIHVASGMYSNDVETFPLVLNRPGIQVLGTNPVDTIINAKRSARVFQAQGLVGDARIAGVTIAGGYLPSGANYNQYGGGLMISNSILEIADCNIVSNEVSTSGYQGSTIGGGVYAWYGTVVISNTVLAFNSSYQNNANSPALGGGIGSYYSDIILAQSALSRNSLTTSGGNVQGYGFGYYSAGGTHRLRNVVIAGNYRAAGGNDAYGVGAYFSGSSVTMENCTVATNYVAGQNYGALYQNGGTVMITNSILFHNNIDCYNFGHDGLVLTNVFASCLGDGQNNGVQGCTNADPQFVDAVYCHLKSHAGQYEDGFFTNGIWGQDPATNSACIDAGAVGQSYENEPNPNGRRRNWGAYGNTPVASRTFLEEPGVFSSLTIHSYGASDVGASNAVMTGEILHSGGIGVADVYLCWDSSDRGTTETGIWANVLFLGARSEFEMVATNVTGLSGTTYFRFFATNSSGCDFSAPCDQVVMAQTPAVTNTGATSVRRRSAVLNGEITFNGWSDPEVVIFYWIHDDAVTNAIGLGRQGGIFNSTVANLSAGTEYEYMAFASNSAGEAWSDIKTFTTLPAGPLAWYVATNGANSAGTNWTTALIDFQEALNIAEAGDMVRIAGGQIFKPLPFYDYRWTTSWITVEGGYETSAIAPGVRDPTLWPTILTRDTTGGGVSRILKVQGVTNGVLRGVTITGGLLPDQSAPSFGGGIYCGNSIFTIDECAITNNETPRSGYGSTSAGGGVYAVDSMLTITNCLVGWNRSSQLLQANSSVRAGGLAIYGGTSVIVRTVIRDNSAPAPASQGINAAGGGFYLYRTTAEFRNCLLITNRFGSTQTIPGTGIYIDGTAVRLMHCTVADNATQGIYRVSGSVGITNSIVWNNNDDLAGIVADVAYACIKDDDFIGQADVIHVDPLFVDRVYYHVQSKAGNYLGGYFGGGMWDISLSNSPCIDAGDSSTPYNREPSSGFAPNLGAYGNTEVASKTVLRGNIVIIR